MRLTQFARIIGFWRTFRRHKGAVAGLITLACFSIVGALGDFIAPHNPLTAGVGNPHTPPNTQFPMGTDDLGRDVFSQVILGARVSLAVGLCSCLFSALLGISVGCISGYFGGRIDDLLMRITEVFLTIPMFVLALVTVVFIGRSVVNIVLVVGFVLWPSTARLVRAEFLSLKEKEFVEAARALGYGDLNIILKEILPNALGPAIVNTTIQMAQGILVESGLSFLGAGDISLPSWGQTIRGGLSFLRGSPWVVAFPSIAVVVTILSINLVGDGLNYVLSPKRHYL